MDSITLMDQQLSFGETIKLIGTAIGMILAVCGPLLSVIGILFWHMLRGMQAELKAMPEILVAQTTCDARHATLQQGIEQILSRVAKLTNGGMVDQIAERIARVEAKVENLEQKFGKTERT